MESISYSEIKLFRRCAKAHQYRYLERLKRRRPNRPALVGTILHDMLDAYVKRGTGAPWAILEKYQEQYAKLFREEAEEFGDIPKLAKAIYQGYWRRWKESDLVFVESEVEFRVELTPKIELMGYIDKIAEDSRARLVTDHKFHKSIPGPDERFSDIQTVLYFWSWNIFRPKMRASGVLWDYGRMKAPSIPELLKSGKGLSKAKKVDTDAFTFRKTLKKHGLDEKPYREFIKSLEGKERTFFERVPLPAPSKHLINQVVEDARLSAIAAKKALKTGKAPRSMSGFNCNGCEFRPLCEAEVRGLDSKFVRKKQYEVREKIREKKYGEVEEAA